jgi:hypothetical protein
MQLRCKARRKIVDLLPGRPCATFAHWLQAHPEVGMISGIGEQIMPSLHVKRPCKLCFSAFVC